MFQFTAMFSLTIPFCQLIYAGIFVKIELLNCKYLFISVLLSPSLLFFFNMIYIRYHNVENELPTLLLPLILFILNVMTYDAVKQCRTSY